MSDKKSREEELGRAAQEKIAKLTERVQKDIAKISDSIPKPAALNLPRPWPFNAVDHILAEQDVVRTVRLHPETISELAKAIAAELKS